MDIEDEMIYLDHSMDSKLITYKYKWKRRESSCLTKCQATEIERLNES